VEPAANLDRLEEVFILERLQSARSPSASSEGPRYLPPCWRRSSSRRFSGDTSVPRRLPGSVPGSAAGSDSCAGGWRALSGASAGLLQDAFSGGLLGYNGISKTTVGYLAGIAGRHLIIRGWSTGSCSSHRNSPGPVDTRDRGLCGGASEGVGEGSPPLPLYWKRLRWYSVSEGSGAPARASSSSAPQNSTRIARKARCPNECVRGLRP
jgi:hypothetical protein